VDLGDGPHIDGPLGVLANCAVNMEQAPALQRPRVRQLDWLAGELPTAGEHRWAWGADDLAALPRITTYLAADGAMRQAEEGFKRPPG